MSTKFFKTLNQGISKLSPAEKINFLKQIGDELQNKIAYYKQAMHDGYHLLWEKRNKYTQLLFVLQQTLPLDGNQLSILDQEINQLQTDIDALTTLLANEGSGDIMTYCESQMSKINNGITALEKNARA